MSDTIKFSVDGNEVAGRPGQTILQAAEDNGLYIPRLCWVKKLKPGATCRLCTVLVNNRPVAACTQPITEGMIVLNETDQLVQYRKNLIEMLFVEGNHFCMFCEKSGNCELQAMAYRLGITAPHYPYLFPRRDLDASHPDIFIDRNRCIFAAAVSAPPGTWTASTCSNSSAGGRRKRWGSTPRRGWRTPTSRLRTTR